MDRHHRGGRAPRSVEGDRRAAGRAWTSRSRSVRPERPAPTPRGRDRHRRGPALRARMRSRHRLRRPGSIQGTAPAAHLRRGRCGQIRDTTVPASGKPDPRLRHPVAGSPEDVPRRSDIDRDAVRAERQNEIGERPGRLDAVLDKHDRRRALRPDARQAPKECGGAIRVQVGRGLIEDDDRRTCRKYAGEGESLLLPARQPVRAPSFQTGETRLADGLGDAQRHGRASPAAVLQPERDVILHPLHDELRPRVLEHETHSSRDFARCRRARIQPGHPKVAGHVTRQVARDEPGDGQAERALAGPRRPDDEQTATDRHLERDTPDRRTTRAPIADLQPTGQERWLGQPGNPSSTPLRRSDRYSTSDPPAAIAAADTAIASRRTTWTFESIVG